jgi:c-di-GMP-binding flagellar brake protein YcgR
MGTLRDSGKEQIERRENKRYSVPAIVTGSFCEGDNKRKLTFRGFIQDISLGGVSIEIRDDFFIISEALLIYTTVEMSVALNFPDGAHQMDFSGVIRWYRRRREDSRNFLYLGIKFNTLSEDHQALVKKYMSLGQGDKNLICNLWDSMSNHAKQ